MKQEISLKDPLEIGDVVELHFKTLGFFWLRATTVALLERRLQQKDPRFDIIGTELPDEKTVIFTIRIRKPPADKIQIQEAAIITSGIIMAAIIAIGGGLFLYLSLGKVYKIIETPAGQVGTIGLGVIAVAIAFLFLRKK